MNQSNSMSGPSRAGVAPMFNRIAHRYDLLNSVLSFGMDRNWRKKLLAALPKGNALQVLDLATGTADVAIALSKLARVEAITGVDIATEMLAFGEQKLKKQGIQKVVLEEGDALALEKFHGQYNAITISFGIRNVMNLDLALDQMRQTLKPQGRALILEFSEPTSFWFGPLYRTYRKHLLPRIGGTLSGDGAAYRYLDDTISTFPSGEDFLDHMRKVGFKNVKATQLTMGSVSLYTGDRD